MKRVFLGLLMFALVACTPSQVHGAGMYLPDARADRITAGVGEPVEVTVIGGFEAIDQYYLEEFVQPGVSLGACFSYVSNVVTEGGLCPGGERPLPDGLSMVDGTTVAKDFGDIAVKRGEHVKIEHTFTFTSSLPGEVDVVPAYLFTYDADIDPSYEPGGLNIIRVTFK